MISLFPFFLDSWRQLRRKLSPLSPPEKGFAEWCRKPPLPAPPVENLVLENKQGGPLSDKEITTFFEGLYDKLAASFDSVVNIRINNYFGSETILVGRSLSYRRFIQLFSVPSMYRSLTLDAFYISKFSLGTQSYNQDNRIIIKNSRIGALTIGNDIDLELQNTFVGKLVLVTGSLKRFTMYGGGVSQLEVSPSSTPFRGSVWFSNTWFPTDKHLADKAQPYRNMRHHLRDLGNVRMADLFHVLELKTERQDESWTNKTFSWLYENFSEYGSSILRPIRLLLLLGILVSLILIFFDGAVVTDALKQDASGWRTALLGDDCYARVLRGFYLSFYFIFHPLGLGEQPVLIASTPWLAGLLVIEGILSVTLITLTIFALRRRFKLQQA